METGQQVRVHTACGFQFPMGPGFHDLTTADDQDPVSPTDGGETVGHQEGGPPPGKSLEGLLDPQFGSGIHRRGGLIQDQDGGIHGKRPGKGQELTLSIGKPISAFTEADIETGRPLPDGLQDIRAVGGLLDLVIGDLLPEGTQVLPDGIGEEVQILEDQAEKSAISFRIELPDVDAVEEHPACHRIPESTQEIDDGGFPATGWPHKGDLLASVHLETHVMQDGLPLPVAETHVLEGKTLDALWQGPGPGRPLDVGRLLEGGENTVSRPTGGLKLGDLFREHENGPVDLGDVLGKQDQGTHGKGPFIDPANAQEQDQDRGGYFHEAQPLEDAVIDPVETDAEAVEVLRGSPDSTQRPARAIEDLEDAGGADKFTEDTQHVGEIGAILTEPGPEDTEGEPGPQDHQGKDGQGDEEEADIHGGKNDEGTDDHAEGHEQTLGHGGGHGDDALWIGFDAAHQFPGGNALGERQSQTQNMAKEIHLQIVDGKNTSLLGHPIAEEAHHGRAQEGREIRIRDIAVDDVFQDQGLKEDQENTDKGPEQGEKKGPAIGPQIRIDAPNQFPKGIGPGGILLRRKVFIPPHLRRLDRQKEKETDVFRSFVSAPATFILVRSRSLLHPGGSMRLIRQPSVRLLVLLLCLWLGRGFAYYTTHGQDIIDRRTGDVVQLRGFGLGGWLLPEGYMWGIRVLDSPRQFEAAIAELIGPRAARKFWDLYHENFVTREDVRQMKAWGVNTLRIPLLASMLQPRDDQPGQPPYRYVEESFRFLDSLVMWCEELEMGIIWDLHGAPGSQNAENISDSDGEARLWTEPDVYWPRTVDLWDVLVRRYRDADCIVGYDLLNEPLLARYPGVDPGRLRKLYLELTAVIRKTDSLGIIFVEGDDWAQDFSVLEPLDWDRHLALAFHSYPPTRTASGLKRWDTLRQRYDIPLWHGETGEQNRPWTLYAKATAFLDTVNVGWNWWTHKKFDLERQPWSIPRTEGFEKILAYWKGEGPRPSRRQARRWLFDQARRTRTEYCEFLPAMVASLGLDPTPTLGDGPARAPVIRSGPRDTVYREGYGATLEVLARGYPLHYRWYRDGEELPAANTFQLRLQPLNQGNPTGRYTVEVYNEYGLVRSGEAKVDVLPFQGLSLENIERGPVVDGEIDAVWREQVQLTLERLVLGDRDPDPDLTGWFSAMWDADALYLLIEVRDDTLRRDSAVDYLNDGVEIYVDGDNDKNTWYDDDDFQLRWVWGAQDLRVVGDDAFPGVEVAAVPMQDGYRVECRLPWSGFGRSDLPREFLGLDIHVNDNDSGTRDAKLAWYATRDNSWQSPAVFGTVRLKP